MCGVQRIPTILYNNPSATLESVNAFRLEIQTTEPVHDIGGHAENFLNSLDTWMSAPSNNSMKLWKEVGIVKDRCIGLAIEGYYSTEIGRKDSRAK